MCCTLTPVNLPMPPSVLNQLIHISTLWSTYFNDPNLQMRKLRHETQRSNSREVSQLVSDRARICIWAANPWCTLSFLCYTSFSISHRPLMIWDRDLVFLSVSHLSSQCPAILHGSKVNSFLGNWKFSEAVSFGGSRRPLVEGNWKAPHSFLNFPTQGLARSRWFEDSVGVQVVCVASSLTAHLGSKGLLPPADVLQVSPQPFHRGQCIRCCFFLTNVFLGKF